MTSPCGIKGCDRPAQSAVGQGHLAQHWGSRKASWRWYQNSFCSKRALQLEGRERGEDYRLSPVAGAGPSLGGRQAWGGEVTGQAQETRARTTDPGAPQARVLKRAPRPPVPVAQGEDWPGPGQQEAAAP